MDLHHHIDHIQLPSICSLLALQFLNMQYHSIQYSAYTLQQTQNHQRTVLEESK